MSLHSPCSEESFGHFLGWTEGTNQSLSNEDLFLFPPEIFQHSPEGIVETRENPGTVLHVKDLGNNRNAPGSWKQNQYHRIELVLDRNCLPIIVDEESWCKGNCKTPKPEITSPYWIISVCAIAEEELVKPCRQPTCPSTSARKVVQVTSSSQLLDFGSDTNGNRTEIKCRVLCIPFHHRNLVSFSLRFVIKDNNGNDVCFTTLDIGKPTANRSNKRTKVHDPGFHNPPLGFVLVLIKATHLTFRTKWRAVQH